ncbi:GNAT family N-acetyltransferase [Variovorax sp. J22R133]|uniref:GNAT family N-acetyltransferase n=1 Tax=Variovorax brevis TaxID=3053503 RepID=UPI002575D51F|nr:GNAT family N-acetyltransferase [Variovorax sp. J22R133]MDM0111940.1 GNAT family N-acetyltransferase [Variovorax sp. J22R133]
MALNIRPLLRNEMALAIDFAALEGWNPGLHDAACFYAADPEGFMIAEMDGKPIGCIAAVRYEEHFGFIGFYVVAPPWRGKGIGLELWRAGMTRLTGRVIGLDGVLGQQDNYRRSGFSTAWQNARFASVTRAAGLGVSAQIVPLQSVKFDMVRADDRRVFPAARDSFLHAWLQMPDATGFAWMERRRLAGWGVIRRCREGHKIGPLVADNRDIAKGLYLALCRSVPVDETVYLDIPLSNAKAVTLTQSLGMQRVFETARMYAGKRPAVEMERIFGITTFELG